MITSLFLLFMADGSGSWRDCEFRSVYFCTGDSSHAVGCVECVDRVRHIMWDTDDRAVLAAMFLKEELGPLGRIGCAICLIGSVIIVLHAPPDTDIETVDEILNFALQPGIPFLLFAHDRIPVLLFSGCGVCFCHDIPCRAHLRKEESSRIHLNMLVRRIRIRHVNQRIRNCCKTHICRKQSIHTSINLCLCNRRRRLYPRTNELLQQSPRPILNIHVPPP
jgi:hypothetical protein